MVGILLLMEHRHLAAFIPAPRQGMQIDDEPDAFPVSERKHLFKVVEHAVEPGVVLSEIAVGAGLSPVADHLGADEIHVPLSERVEILRLESDRGHLARARIVNSTKLSALGARSNSASAQFIAFLFSGRMTTRRYCFPSRVSSVAHLQSFQSDLSGTAEAVSQNSRSGRKNFRSTSFYHLQFVVNFRHLYGGVLSAPRKNRFSASL